MTDTKRTNISGFLAACFGALALCGCGHQSETDKHAATEDISVRIIAVLQKPAAQLSWIDEHSLPQLTPEEKMAIATNGVTGQLEVVYSAGRGSGSREVRVVIIQTSPLSADAILPVPESGSFIYIQDDGRLKPLFTNSVVSSLKLEIYQEKRETSFFMDYPRDRVRSGGSIFWWDENGKWHEI